MLQKLKENSIICAVKSDDSFAAALQSDCEFIFLLNANICTVEDYVARAHQRGKQLFLHIDLAEGFGRDEATLRYIATHVNPDGIISTRNQMIKIAQEKGMQTVLRVFLVDSQSLETAIVGIEKQQPDAVEIMPGVAFQAIKELKRRESEMQVIAGGFIRTEDDCRQAFACGATACSTSNLTLWK